MLHNIQSVLIPENIGVVRELACPYARDGSEILKEDLVGYDRYTVFYDVFFSTKNNKLMAIGPPLLNLKQILFPLVLEVNGIKVEYNIVEEYPKVFWIIIDCETEHIASWNIHFRFACGWEKSLEVSRSVFFSTSVLITMQKDNTIRRIEDWITHYRTRFEIDQVFIYDNNSRDFESMASTFPNINFVAWNFPFGIITSKPNKYAQRGALNHFLYKFTENTRIFQFDIDELAILHVPQKNGVSYYLKDHILPLPEKMRENYSFCDYETADINNSSLHEYKYRKPNMRHHNKYICQSDRVSHLEVHCFTPKNNSILRALLKGAWGGWKRLKRFEGLFCLFVRWISFGRIRFLPYRSGRYDHYLGITTPWKKNKKKKG